MTSNYDYIEMRFPAAPEYVGLVRLTLSGVFNRAGASYEDIEDSKIAVSEAVTNAVKHAYSDKVEGEILIGYLVFEDKIEIIVSDSGKSFNYEEAKKVLGPYQESDNINFLRTRWIRTISYWVINGWSKCPKRCWCYNKYDKVFI